MTGFNLLGLLALTACNPDKKDLDEDGYVGAEDCDDEDASVNPGQAEVCDGIDNDCDGGIDNDAGDATTWYADADGDGYGGTLTLTACDQPSGYLADSDDCDDLDAAVNPGGLEICDGIDNDCDDLIDTDDDSVDESTAGTWYADVDGDGYGDDNSSQVACDQPGGHVDVGGDCDDQNATYNPETRWHEDGDGDGYGAPDYYVEGCEGPASGYTLDDQDCDDLDPTINPDGLEVCDGADNDCDGLWDDDDDSVDVETMTDWYKDKDADGYGDENATAVTQCAQPSGKVTDNTDCDDDEVSTNPGEEEVCDDGVDNDCSGDAPECGIGDADITDAGVTGSGEAASDYYGRTVVVLDYDGDGSLDIAAGSFGNDENGTSAGAAYVHYGPSTALDAESADVTLRGDSSYDYAGYSLANAGDVDADGDDELLVGGYYAGYGYGHAWLIYGGTTSSGLTPAGASWYGENSYDYLGLSVAGLGDVNGDGYDDIAFSTPYHDDGDTNAGAVYIIYGAATALSGNQDFSDADQVIWGETYYGNLGYWKAIAGGDLDGDGISDLTVNEGSSYADAYLYLMYGDTSASWSSPSDADATFGGGEYTFGRNTVLGEDLDQDGYNDILTTDYYGDSYYGALYVFQGSASGFSGSYTTGDAYASFGGENTYDYLGLHAAEVADLDGDGSQDVVAGSPYWEDSAGSFYSSGKVYVFSGPVTGGAVAATDAASTISGDQSYGYVGWSVATGDLDGDGIDDAVVGEYGDSSYAGFLGIFTGGSM